MRILTLVSPAALVRLLAAAESLNADIVRARSWAELAQRIRNDPTGIVVVDPYWHQMASIHDIAALYRNAPLVPIVVYTTPHPTVGKLLPTLYRYGVRDCLFLGQGDGKARIAHAVAVAGRNSIPDQILMRLAPIIDALDESQQSHVRHLLHDAAGAPSVTALADACGVSTRHLLRWCTDAGLPAPSQLLLGARCAQALVALSNTEMTVANAAGQVGQSRQTLHRRTRAVLQTTPRQAARALVMQSRMRDTDHTQSDIVATRLSVWTD